jgi:hypothetical protein
LDPNGRIPIRNTSLSRNSLLDIRPETPEVGCQTCYTETSALEKTTDAADFPTQASSIVIEAAEVEEAESSPEWGLQDLETMFQWRNNKFR